MPEYTPDQIDARIMKDPDMQDLADKDPTQFETTVNQLYHQFGYGPDRKELPTAQKLFGKISRSNGIPESTVQGAAAVPLPAIGTIAGALATPFAPMAGAAVGSLAGEEANAQLGITEPMTTSSRALALLSPLAGPAISRTKEFMAKHVSAIPGAGAGMHDIAGETMDKAFNLARVSPAQVAASRIALGAVPSFRIKIPQTQQLFKDEMNLAFKQSEKLGLPGADADLKTMTEIYNKLTTASSLSFKDLMVFENGLNKLKRTSGDPIWKRAAGTIIDDLEKASTDPALAQTSRDKAAKGLAAFRNVVHLSKQSAANEALDSITNKVFQPVAGNTLLNQFNKKLFLKELKTNQALKDAYTPDELKNMSDAVDNLGWLANPSANPIQNPLGFVGRSGPLAAVGYAAGGQSGAMLGFGAASVLSTALSTDKGRQIVKYLATNGKGRINGLELKSMIGQVMAGASAGTAAALQAPTEESTNAFPNQE